jgi:hypothetical protein
MLSPGRATLHQRGVETLTRQSQPGLCEHIPERVSHLAHMHTSCCKIRKRLHARDPLQPRMLRFRLRREGVIAAQLLSMISYQLSKPRCYRLNRPPGRLTHRKVIG